jgi:hypothetical protein
VLISCNTPPHGSSNIDGNSTSPPPDTHCVCSHPLLLLLLQQIIRQSAVTPSAAPAMQHQGPAVAPHHAPSGTHCKPHTCCCCCHRCCNRPFATPPAAPVMQHQGPAAAPPHARPALTATAHLLLPSLLQQTISHTTSLCNISYAASGSSGGSTSCPSGTTVK